MDLLAAREDAGENETGKDKVSALCYSVVVSTTLCSMTVSPLQERGLTIMRNVRWRLDVMFHYLCLRRWRDYMYHAMYVAKRLTLLGATHEARSHSYGRYHDLIASEHLVNDTRRLHAARQLVSVVCNAIQDRLRYSFAKWESCSQYRAAEVLLDEAASLRHAAVVKKFAKLANSQFLCTAFVKTRLACHPAMRCVQRWKLAHLAATQAFIAEGLQAHITEARAAESTWKERARVAVQKYIELQKRTQKDEEMGVLGGRLHEFNSPVPVWRDQDVSSVTQTATGASLGDVTGDADLPDELSSLEQLMIQKQMVKLGGL